VPTRSLSAAILDGDRKIAHGTVSNMSETGAFLVTDHGLAQGLAVRLVLSEGRDRILDTKAHIVWSADGFDPSSEIVGALQGVLFADLSPLNREQLRKRLLFTEVMNPGFLKNYPPDEEELAYLLIDPDIEYLISDEKIDYNDGIAQIRQELAPYLEQFVTKLYEERSWGDDATRATLEYLEHQVSGYPFDRKLDCEFIVELMADFPGIDILEEVKTFRWHYDGQPVCPFTNPRAALRRWLVGNVNDNGNGHYNGNGNGNGRKT
jgi:hypothetical protein